VYVDAGQTGHFVMSDAGVPGVTVNLTGVTLTGQSVSQTTQTASDGTYRFTNLQAGVYTLSDVQPPGFTAGAENLGSLGGTVVNNQMVLALPQGGTAMCYDFGEILPTPPPPPPNGGGIPIPPPNTPSNPPSTPADPPSTLSKRFLLGDGWQSLG
jgi:hypothetical protein